VKQSPCSVARARTISEWWMFSGATKSM
jgi:hypothetical protein